MLVRALKVLRFSQTKGETALGIATAALNQPGDEAALIKEQSGYGNNEPSTLSQ
jgi:hypothetical protein